MQGGKMLISKILKQLQYNQCFYINNGSHDYCVKGVPNSDEPADNYHPTLQLLSFLSFF